MRNEPFSNDITEYLRRMEQRIRSLETRETGTIYLDKQIIVEDEDGVRTIIGNIPGEDRKGIKEWIGDVTPPPVPTSPMVTSHPGFFSISWDGANHADAPAAPDFSHLNVYASDGTSTFLVGIISKKDEVAVFADVGEDKLWDFWFTSVDHNGNESEMSEVAEGFASELVQGDTREAVAPTGLVANTEIKFSRIGGDPYGELTLTWDPVTKATNGTDLNIVSYEVVGVDSEGREYMSRVGSAKAVLNVDAGSTWTVKVRAFSKKSPAPGMFSDELEVVVPLDTVAPPKPSAPVVKAFPGFFHVYWDGTNDAGAQTPPDYEKMEIHATNGVKDVLVGVITYPEEIAMFADGQDSPSWDFWSVSIDNSGNRSVESDRVTESPKVFDGTDKRIAKAPTGLAQTSSVKYRDNGRPYAEVVLTWNAVTQATDNSTIDPSVYEVWGRQGDTEWVLSHTVVDTTARVMIDNGSTWEFKVRANPFIAVNAGEYSSVVSVNAPVDDVAPPTPSAPILTTWLRTITASWNALPSMPVDFSHINVYINGTKATTLPGVGSYTTGSMPAGVPVKFRFSAVDFSGNESALSAEATITPQSNVDLSEITDHIDATKVRLDNLGLTDLGEGTTLGDALASANTELGNLDTELGNLKTDLETAEQAIADGKAIWEPLPGRIEEAEGVAEAAAQSASTARNEATAAAASAAEANNRAMTRLANGNFEDGLKYWQTEGNVSLTEDSHSGATAVLLTGSGANLMPESSLPVVEGQIWEIQVYYKALDPQTPGEDSLVVSFGTPGSPYQRVTQHTGPVGEWASTGPVRYTVPEGVDAIRARVVPRAGTSTRWIVDDIVLRDVTDVVRLEQAATAAAEKADTAQADANALKTRAEAIELAQGGIQTRLDTAEQDLATNAQEAADNLSELDTALQTFATNKANTAKSEAISAAATDAQEKADAARDYAKAVAGQAENIIPDPNVRTPMWDFFTGGIVRTEGGPTVGMIELPSGGNVYAFPLARELGQPVTTSGSGRVIPVKEGQVWEVEGWYRTTEDYVLASANYSGLRLGRDAANTYITRPAGQTAKNTEWTQMKARWTVPAGTTGVQLWIFQSHTAGRIFWADFSMKDVTELVAAENALSTAQATAEGAHTLAGNAVDNASAAMDRANEVKGEAEEYADALPKALHGTTPPSGVAPDGSTWEQHKNGLASPVIGRWTRVNGSWQSTPIDGMAVSNMDVGYLTSGGATIGEAVVSRLFTDIFTANKITARELAVSSGNLFPDPLFHEPVGAWSRVGTAIEKSGTGSQSGSYNIHLKVAVEPGDEIYVTADVSAVAGTLPKGTVSIYGQRRNRDGASLSAVTLLARNTNVATFIEGSYIVPSGTHQLTIGFYTENTLTSSSKVRIENVRILRKSDNVTISNGAITADKITVTTDLTAKIVAGTEGIFDHMTATKSAWLNNLTATGITNIENLTVTGASKFSKAIADQMFVDMFTANKITSRELTISGGNLVDDAVIDGPGWGGKSMSGGASSSDGWTIVSTTGGPGQAVYMTRTAGTIVFNSQIFTVEDNADGSAVQFRVNLRARNDRTGAVALRVYWFDYNGNQITYKDAAPIGTTSGSSWASNTEVISAPSNARYGQAAFYATASTSGSVWFIKPEISRMTSTVHIEDGAVIADKLASNAVQTKHLVASESSFTKLMGAYQIKAGNIDTNSLTADEAFIGSVWAGGLEVATGVPSANVDIGAIQGKLSIGARNLIIGSGGTVIDRIGSTPGSRLEYNALNVGQSYMDIPHGTEVTLSFDIEMHVGTSGSIFLQVYNTNTYGPKQFQSATKSWTGTTAGDVITERVVLNSTITDRSSPSRSDNWIEFYSSYGTNNFYKISNIKLERGKTSTDWSPAPEDIESRITEASENMVPDPHIKNAGNWKGYQPITVHTSGGPTVGMIEVPSGSNSYSFPIVREIPPAFSGYTSAKVTPVEPDQIWEFTAWYKTSSDYTLASSNFSGIRVGDSTNGYKTRPAGETSSNTSWTKMTGTYRIPAGMNGMQVWIFQSHTAGTIWWADFSVKNVTTPASQLTSGVLPSGTDIRTGTGNARVSISPQGIKAYNSSGENTVAINSDGSAHFKGVVSVGSSVPATTVSGQLSSGNIPSLPQSKVSGLDTIKAVTDRATDIFRSSPTYLNPFKDTNGLVLYSGSTPSVVSSADALQGTALMKNSNSQVWVSDTGGRIAFDPSRLYRVEARVRVTKDRSNGTSGGFYAGLNGISASGVLVNASGSNTHSSQHYIAAANSQLKVADGWTTFVGYVRGHGSGSGSVSARPDLLSPGVMHKDVAFIEPMLILDYSGGDGNWEVSHFSISSVDGSQMDTLADASAKATAANDLTNKWKDPRDTTKIDGGNIYTGTIDANSIKANTFNATHTFTGPKFESSVPGSPGRVVLYNGGLIAYGSNGSTVMFSVQSDGRMKATDGEFSGTLKGTTIDANGGLIQTDSRNYYGVKMDNSGIRGYSGGSSTPKFSLSSTGKLIATDAEITGTITSGSTVPATTVSGALTQSNIPTLSQSKVSGLPADLQAKLDAVVSGGSGKQYTNMSVFNQSGNGIAGSIVFDTPITFGNYMTTVSFEGYDYVNNASEIRGQVSFYAFSTPAFVNTSSTSSGSCGIKFTLARRKSTGTVSIIIDKTASNSLWYYPKMVAASATIGHTPPPDSFKDWTSRLVTSTTEYDILTDPGIRDIGDSHTLTQKWRQTGKTTIDGGHLENDSITSGVIHATQGITSRHTITGATFQTSTNPTTTSGVLMNSSGIHGYSGSTRTFFLNTSGKLVANNAEIFGKITGGTIEGKTSLVGGVIQSSTSATRGVKMDDTGFRAYNTSGVKTFDVSASTGNVEITGVLKQTGTVSGASGTHSLVVENGVDGPGMYFKKPSGAVMGRIFFEGNGVALAGPKSNSLTDWADPYIRLQNGIVRLSSETSGAPEYSSIDLYPHYMLLEAYSGKIRMSSYGGVFIQRGSTNAPEEIVVSEGAWNFLSLQPGWTTFGQGYPGPQWRLEGNTIRLRGVLTGSSSTTTFAYLPAGHKPIYSQLHPVAAWTTQSTPYRLTVLAGTGALSFAGVNSGASWISLDGVVIPLT